MCAFATTATRLNLPDTFRQPRNGSIIGVKTLADLSPFNFDFLNPGHRLTTSFLLDFSFPA
jgi:hypothetical protein